PDVVVERRHLPLELGAFGAGRQVFRQLSRRGARLRADHEACFTVVHATPSLSESSGAGVRPYRVRSLLRARKSRVSTAVEDRLSSCAISAVENPPSTCIISGSRYSNGS